MPDVRIVVADEFINNVQDDAAFCRGVRKAVAELFGFDTAPVCVQLEFYAPGCEDGRPPVVVAISTKYKEERIPQQADLTQRLADQVKRLADEAVGKDVGQIKTRIDLVCRATATAGSTPANSIQNLKG
ncbi:MAG: hypothetical protein ABSE18_01340 [Minisyncoccia bacterium]|jgi:hypothetical protein